MILALMSGGLDSTGMVWKLLSEGETLHIHHVDLYTENRVDITRAEKDAVSKIVQELRKDFRFKFTTSKVDLSGLNGKVVDIVSCMYDAYGALSAAYALDPDLRYTAVARAATRDDLDLMNNPGYDERRHRAQKAWDAFETSIPIIFPVEDMTKAQLWDSLPDRLRYLTTSCRFPYISEGEWKACGKCPACQELVRSGLPLSRRLQADTSNE